LLELYLHLTRVAEVLIENKKIRLSTITKVWLILCINIFIKHIEEKFEDNQAMDKHRLERYKQVEKLVKSEISLSKKALPSKEKIKNLLTTQTVQQIRSLYVMNADLGLMTAILATQYRQSSHSKETMPPALMVMTLYFQEKTAGHAPQLIRKKRVRVPSITASKTLTVSENLAIALARAKTTSREITTYQLLTSLHEVFDIANQTRTALQIFVAAHTLNSETPDNPTVVIFNLPVNQHSAFLSHSPHNHQTVGEAMVMADLALLYKMSRWRTFDSSGRFLAAFEAVRTRYARFLTGYTPTQPSNLFAYTAHDHKGLVAALTEAKNALLEEVMGTPATTPRARLEQALVKLYCLKYSGDSVPDQLPYGLPVQALFSALDENNLIGCKSANERFFLTEGLTQVFEAFLYQSLAPELLVELTRHTQSFLDSTIDPATFVAKFMTLDAQLNVYGSAIGPSLLDTGTPKCEVGRGPASIAITGLTEVSTNIFAPPIFGGISQTTASKVQAHGKSLVKRLSHSIPATPSRIWRAAAEVMATGGGAGAGAGAGSYDPTRDPTSLDFGSAYGSTAGPGVSGPGD
jgi:hypothetical protein